MSLNLINMKFFKMVNPNVTGNDSDLCCRCHICGDSKKSKNKKRLHLYVKKGFKQDIVHCFNCDYSSSAYNYFKEFHPDIFNSYKIEMMDENLSSIKKDEISLDVFKEEKNSELLTLEEFKKITNPLTKESAIYLLGRGLDKHDIKNLNIRVVEGEFELYDKKINVSESIIIPFLTKDDKVFGFQTRSIKEKQFYIILHPDYSGQKIWNIEKIDRTKTIYVFEGIFDAISSGLDNKIALLGIHNCKNLDKELDYVFCLDNQKLDETSNQICKTLAKQNKKIFIWDRNDVKDFNELLSKTRDKNQIKEMILNNIKTGLEAYVRL